MWVQLMIITNYKHHRSNEAQSYSTQKKSVVIRSTCVISVLKRPNYLPYQVHPSLPSPGLKSILKHVSRDYPEIFSQLFMISSPKSVITDSG
jgi:hypothetical protein